MYLMCPLTIHCIMSTNKLILIYETIFVIMLIMMCMCTCRPPILGQVSVEGKKAPSRPTRRSRSMYVVPSKSSKETKPPPVVVPAPVVGMKKRRSSTGLMLH